MSIQFQLASMGKLVTALAPATDAAGRSGVWVNLSFAHKMQILFNATQGNAATIALTFQQAKDAAGTGAKALSANLSIWANQDVVATDTLVAQAAAASFTTSAAVKNKMILFEAVPQEILDVANGFKYIQIITGASNAANITQALYLAMPLRLVQATPPTLIT